MRDFEQDAFCYEDWRSDTMNDLTNRGLDVSEVNYCLDRLDELHDATVAAERERVKNALHRDCEQMFGLTEDETMEQLPRVRFLLCPTQDSDVGG